MRAQMLRVSGVTLPKAFRQPYVTYPLDCEGGSAGSGASGGAQGLVSTAAQNAGNTALAVVESSRVGATSWNGFGIDDDETIIVAYVLKGDANVDGVVNFVDLVRIAQNYGNTSGAASWDMADFNYDGNVGFADLVSLAQNYNGSLPAQPIDGAAGNFDRDLAVAFASVPEPSSLFGSALLGGCALLRRTRRRRTINRPS